MKNRILRPVKDDGNEGDMPTRSNMFEPCELYMLRDQLIGMLQMNLETIAANLPKLELTPDQELEADAVVRQRTELLEWATRQPGDTVFVALYPTRTEEEQEPKML